jgi:hypothetical protein
MAARFADLVLGGPGVSLFVSAAST